MASIWNIVLYTLIISNCEAVIYHLNDTEYERMPPLFGLDDYQACLIQRNNIYCMVQLDLHGALDNELMNLIKGYSEHTVKHYNHTYIQRGVCVQKTCESYIKNINLENSGVLNKTLETCLNDSIWRDYKLEARLSQVIYCDKQSDTKEKDFSDWFVAAIFVLIIVINIIGSFYDAFFLRVKNENSRRIGNQFLLSFSVIQNWRWLTSMSQTDPTVERLIGLHGYKTITIFIMAIAHVIWVNSMGFTQNPHDFEKAYETVQYQLIFNGMMIVQIFFVLSGFLMAYNLLIYAEKETISLKMFPKILFMRWWRLTPAYAVVLAFTATWLRHLGSGPLWRLWVADSVAAECRSYWWMHLLYINNYFPEDRFCAIHTWHLGADMQVFVITTFLFLATRHNRRILLLSGLLIVGLLLPALHAWLHDLDGVMIMNPEFFRNKLGKAFEVHVLGHNYLACYAIGMGTAFLLHHLHKKGIDTKTNKVLQVLSWCFIPAIVCLFLSGRGFYADAPRAHLAARVVWAAGHRLFMSSIVAFGVICLFMRFSETYCALFEWPGWVVPGRLSYSVFLLHLNFVHVLIGNRAYLTQVSYYNMIIVHFGVVAITFVVALPFYLMVEAPPARLMKVIISRQFEQTHLKK